MITEPVTLLASQANAAASDAPRKRPDLPGYVSPSIEIVYYPERPNLFDGFAVSGRVWGSELQGAFVYVTISGVTRRAKVIDGLWTIFFEDDCLPRHFCGHKDIVAQFRDNLGHIARTSVNVYFEAFADSFITVDNVHKIIGKGASKELLVSGELNLGTHLEGRELIVLLVTDDAEARVVSAGELDKGWAYGEWRATIPLASVKSGNFRVRAQLLDGANPALTRVMDSTQAIIL